MGRHDYAVTGVAAVVEALRKAQIDTLVLSDDPSSTLTAWIGPEPLQLALSREDIDALGVEQPQQDRLDAALVRALAGSAAALLSPRTPTTTSPTASPACCATPTRPPPTRPDSPTRP